MKNGLDYECITQGNDSFEIWTPDENGACIGCGKTSREAMKNAMLNLMVTATDIGEELE